MGGITGQYRTTSPSRTKSGIVSADYGPCQEALPLIDPTAMRNIAYGGTVSTTNGTFPSSRPSNKRQKVGQQGNDKQRRALKMFKEMQRVC